jgi:hypothetical protein
MTYLTEEWLRPGDIATFGCVTYREQCEVFQATGVEADEPLGDNCEHGFVSFLPFLWDELEPCPGCGGPSELLELLEPAQL